MNDRIQPELPQQSPYESAISAESGTAAMDNLLRRVQVLEREKRRWRWIGTIAIVALLFVTISGGGLAVATVSFFVRQA